jgi:hypothetical protein
MLCPYLLTLPSRLSGQHAFSGQSTQRNQYKGISSIDTPGGRQDGLQMTSASASGSQQPVVGSALQPQLYRRPF